MHKEQIKQQERLETMLRKMDPPYRKMNKHLKIYLNLYTEDRWYKGYVDRYVERLSLERS